MNKLYTPLRYPGGKAKFAPFVKTIMQVNNLVGGHYLEPYAGGAGVAFDLLFNDFASHIHINDFDPAVYDFWEVTLRHTDEILRRVFDTNITMENWYIQKNIFDNPADFNQIDRGFATFFLNRTNRSGILKGGVIGGKEQSGVWKLDERFNKAELLKRIEKIGIHSDKVHVYNEDAIHLLNRINDVLPVNSFIYLDPPYYVKGKGLYRNFYKHEDHIAIKDALKSLNFRWLVSYDNAEEIKDIYNEYRQVMYSLKYSAQKKKEGSEVMIFSDNLIDPATVF